jgi:predicted MPP superfamily phosphohydrolase
MPLFLLTFFTVYGGMHLYAFLKLQRAFAPPPVARVIIVVFMALMVFTPIVVRIAEKKGYVLVAQYLSYAGYFWMGILFVYFAFSLVMESYRLFIYAGEGILQRDFVSMKPSPGVAFILPLVLSLLVSIFGYFEAMKIRTEKVVIRTSKISRQTGSLKIAQISDVHIGLIIREARLNMILDVLREIDPDIIVSTGDLVDGQIDNLSGFSRLFREIHPRYGKFAIPGNHEYYAGFEQAMQFTEESGFTVLRGQGLTAGGIINIAGVDDPAGKRYGLYKGVSEKDLLARLPKDTFTLLLKHRPLVDTEAVPLFDLQLSGHTHKGQIFPFNLVTKIYYPVHAGSMKLDETALLYVSRGTGTWGPPVRFLSPPEITVIELVHAKIP